MLVENREGGYRFLPGAVPFSAGVIASKGYEIVHVTLSKPVPYREGFERIDRRLSRAGRPRKALCAVELRSPRPFSFEGFERFNKEYAELISEWKLLIDGSNPVARSNVVPEILPPPLPSLYAFSYTVPLQDASASFVLAGVGDIGAEGIVRPGEISEDALAEKTAFVVDCLQSRLAEVGATWDQATTTNVYTVQNVHSLRIQEIEKARGESVGHGICWYLARPPIEGLEFEMDIRSVRTEFFL